MGDSIGLIRIALRWIVVALIAATLLVLAAAGLARLRPRDFSSSAELQVPVESIALPLDAYGSGAQVIGPANLNLKLDPYPPRAGDSITLTLVALDRTSQALMTITPTLSVAEPVAVEGTDYVLTRQVNGAYVARGRFFPRPGQWRLRLAIDFGSDEPYRILALVEAK